jgi:anthranilate/para-aminobenzoate synthase component II
LKEICFVDFYDSFSYNLVSDFYDLDVKLNLISYEEFLNREVDLSLPVLLGPGPGAISEYQDFLNFFNKFYYKKVKTAGVCLGHQLLCFLNGSEIIQSKNILHGQAEKLVLTSFWKVFLETKLDIVLVQRYNSLTVKTEGLSEKHLYSSSGELMAILSDHYLSYQFHPESIGTSCRRIFISSLAKYLL